MLLITLQQWFATRWRIFRDIEEELGPWINRIKLFNSTLHLFNQTVFQESNGIVKYGEKGA